MAGAFAVDGRCPTQMKYHFEEMRYDRSLKTCAFSYRDWIVYLPEGDFAYEEAKAKCGSLGATLLTKNAYDEKVIFWCHFVALTLPYVRFNLQLTDYVNLHPWWDETKEFWIALRVKYLVKDVHDRYWWSNEPGIIYDKPADYKGVKYQRLHFSPFYYPLTLCFMLRHSSEWSVLARCNWLPQGV